MKFRPLLIVILLPLASSCSAIAALTGPSGSCRGPQAYSVGTAATDKLGANECGGPGDISGHLYALSLTGQTNFRVAMAPSGFEGSVGIWTSAGKVVFETTGSGTFGAQVFLPAGQYTLVAGRSKLGGGNYSLSTGPTTIDCTDSGPGRGSWTVLGASIAGTIGTTDCAANGNGKQKIYTIWLAAGQTMNVSATSSQNSNLLITGSGNAAAPEVSKFIAKGATVAATYTATSASAYNVHVMSEPGLTGTANFTITIN